MTPAEVPTSEPDELRQQAKEATVPVKEEHITEKLVELDITERVALPISDLKLCIHLRKQRIDARFTQKREVTVPIGSYGNACDLMYSWQRRPSDWLAEGRELLEKAA